jgi:hypothetical protein
MKGGLWIDLNLAVLCTPWGKEQSMRFLIHSGLVLRLVPIAVYVLLYLQGSKACLGFVCAGGLSAYPALAGLWAEYLNLKRS